MIRENPTLGLRAVQMRRFGQEIIEATAGKKIHGTGAIPGGINRNLPLETRDRFLAQVGEMLVWAQDALALARAYVEDHAALVEEFGSFPSNHMSLVREGDGALDLYHGRLIRKERRSSTWWITATITGILSRMSGPGPT